MMQFLFACFLFDYGRSQSTQCGQCIIFYAQTFFRAENVSFSSVKPSKMTKTAAESDPLAIRKRILKEFQKVKKRIASLPEYWRRDTFWTHKQLCKKLGNDFMEYAEFEFWFLRFIQGNFDLNVDRRHELRNVSKGIRIQVDSWDPELIKLSYNTAEDWSFQHKTMSASFRRSIFERKRKMNPLLYTLVILKNPKLRLEELTLGGTDKYWRELVEELDQSNQKLHVKHIHTSSNFDLHYLDPGEIEEITVFLRDPKAEEIQQILESEQYKSARMTHFETHVFPSKFPFECFYKCPKFTLTLGGQPALKIKWDFIKNLLKCAQVQLCHISIYNNATDELKQKIQEEFEEKYPRVDPNNPNIRRQKIPGTNEFYEMEMTDGMMRIERKQ
ncbi:hypothetical protein CRE_11458 [Caenorhabditis remanei]|uniref:Mos1 transposase HTH domain-containing protein n=1 Tax=Caenorhabditis remanei TaxID=31234 RepID=E3NBE5_CAERE|nr:hypothetical protein CRE_11458 [Caenorhabditis remanei]